MFQHSSPLSQHFRLATPKNSHQILPLKSPFKGLTSLSRRLPTASFSASPSRCTHRRRLQLAGACAVHLGRSVPAKRPRRRRTAAGQSDGQICLDSHPGKGEKLQLGGRSLDGKKSLRSLDRSQTVITIESVLSCVHLSSETSIMHHASTKYFFLVPSRIALAKIAKPCIT